MTIGKLLGTAAITAIVVGGAAIGTASAQEWRGGEVRRFEHEAHRFGEFCSYRIETRGLAEKKFFKIGGGPGGSREAEARAIQHWEQTVVSTVGPRFASWERAQGKSVTCHPRGLIDVECIAVANPCREPGARREEFRREEFRRDERRR